MSAAKKRGTAWETAVVTALRARGLPVERRTLSGNRDRGDLSGLPGVVVECKDQARISLSEFCDEAAAEAANDGCQRWYVVVKRRRAGVERAYVICELSQWADDLGADAGRA